MRAMQRVYKFYARCAKEEGVKSAFISGSVCVQLYRNTFRSG